MASCATRFDPLNLGNGAVGTTWRQYPRPLRGNEVEFRNSFKEVTRRQRLVAVSMSHTPVAVNMSQSQAESQLADYFTKEVNAEGAGSIVGEDLRNLQSESEWKTDIGGLGGDIFDGNGRNGKFPGGGGGGAGEGEDQEDEEFGPIMKFEEVIRETEARGATLPSDMLEAAKSVGIRKLLLLRYLDLQGSGGLLGFAMKSCSMLRNRMLADPSFLFKVGTEVLFKLGKSFKKYYDHDVYPKWRIVIDTCCATFAEIQKRGKDFWAEFELYVADLVVGAVVNAALVGMFAPCAFIGQPSAAEGFHGRLQNSYEALPIGVSEAERAGCRFSIKQRIATYFHKGVLYGSIWLACGIIGQGIANLIRKGKRSIRNPEDDIPETPPVKTPVRPDVFSPSQISNGLETLVEASPPATRVALTAVGFLLMLLLLMVIMAFKISVRVTNNIYGGMQFVD